MRQNTCTQIGLVAKNVAFGFQGSLNRSGLEDKWDIFIQLEKVLSLNDKNNGAQQLPNLRIKIVSTFNKSAARL